MNDALGSAQLRSSYVIECAGSRVIADVSKPSSSTTSEAELVRGSPWDRLSKVLSSRCAHAGERVSLPCVSSTRPRHTREHTRKKSAYERQEQTTQQTVIAADSAEMHERALARPLRAHKRQRTHIERLVSSAACTNATRTTGVEARAATSTATRAHADARARMLGLRRERRDPCRCCARGHPRTRRRRAESTHERGQALVI